jgi:hypothetical protein
MTDLFVEIFPLEPDAAATLAAYRLQLEGDLEPGGRNRLGQRLARRLQRTFPGMWLWIEERIITDSERNPVELMITLDILRTERPATYAPLREITLDPDWQPSPRALADASLRGRLRDPELAAAMQAALDQQKTTIHNAQVQREYRLRAWTVADQPAISISIASRLLYHQTVHQYIRLESDRAALNDRLAGLWA